MSELKQIASKDEYVFTTDSFSKLSTLLDAVVALACEGKFSPHICEEHLGRGRGICNVFIITELQYSQICHNKTLLQYNRFTKTNLIILELDWIVFLLNYSYIFFFFSA